MSSSPPKFKYYRHSIVPLEVGLEAIQAGLKCTKMKVTFNGILVNVTSLRLRTFLLKGTECTACGLQATYFAIENNEKLEPGQVPTNFHLNLWGKKGDEDVLFTHDHKLARALGGADTLSNTEPMCSLCNFEKSILEGEEAKRRKNKK